MRSKMLYQLIIHCCFDFDNFLAKKKTVYLELTKIKAYKYTIFSQKQKVLSLNNLINQNRQK